MIQIKYKTYNSCIPHLDWFLSTLHTSPILSHTDHFCKALLSKTMPPILLSNPLGSFLSSPHLACQPFPVLVALPPSSEALFFGPRGVMLTSFTYHNSSSSVLGFSAESLTSAGIAIGTHPISSETLPGACLLGVTTPSHSMASWEALLGVYRTDTLMSFLSSIPTFLMTLSGRLMD